MLQLGTIICEIALIFCGLTFVHREEKRENYKLRVSISTLLVLGLSVVLGLAFGGDFWLSGGALSLQAKLLIQAISTVMLIGYFICNWKMSPSKAAMYYVWTRIVWWLALESWQMLMVVFWPVIRDRIAFGYLVLCAVYFVTTAICDATIARWIPVTERKKVGPRQLISGILVCVVFEMLAYMPELQQAIYVMSERTMLLFLLQLLMAIILYLQNELFRKSAMKQELALVRLLLQKEEEQYRLSKENIAIINQKCHDLKHQIRALRKVSEEDREAYLKEIEDSIRIYEAIVKTGNEVLDTILTEKSLYCKERGITISCVADGKLLNFISHMDLYSLFGNALDNAIEAVEQFEEEEKRQIDVLIYRQQNFLVVNIVNPIRDIIALEDELPVTTKQDKHYHGYGMRSMKYVVKKYEGFFNITQEDGCFSLKFLFPYRNA